MAESTPPAGKRGNVLTRKYGPAPGYAYIVVGGIAGYVIIRRRAGAGDNNGDQAAADTSSTDTSSGAVAQDGTGFGETQPYDMSGQVYTDLAGTQAQLQEVTTKEQQQHKKLLATRKQLKGAVAPKFRTVTIHKGDDTLAELAKKYHTTKAKLEHLNPQLKDAKGHVQKLKPGERVLVPTQ